MQTLEYGRRHSWRLLDPGRSAGIRFRRRRKSDRRACTVRCWLAASSGSERSVVGPESPVLLSRCERSGFGTRVDEMERVAVEVTPGQQHPVTSRAASARASCHLGAAPDGPRPVALSATGISVPILETVSRARWHRDATCVTEALLAGFLSRSSCRVALFEVMNETANEGTERRDRVLLLTIIDAARVLSIGRTSMYELIGAGEIDVVHIGRSAGVSRFARGVRRPSTLRRDYRAIEKSAARAKQQLDPGQPTT